MVHRGKSKPCLRIVRKVFAAAADSTLSTAGVTEHRQAALERMGWTLTDWERARTDQSAVEARMVAVLGQLGLTDLVCSIDGLSPVGAAAILAETGDLRRFTSARAVVKLPAWRRGSDCPAPSPVRPACPVRDAPGCG